MASSRLLIGMRMIVGAKIYSIYVVHNKCLLYGLCDGCLGFTLWKVVGHEGGTNLELRWVAGASIPGDTYLEFLVVEDKPVLEHYFFRFFHGEGKECEVLV